MRSPLQACAFTALTLFVGALSAEAQTSAHTSARALSRGEVASIKVGNAGPSPIAYRGDPALEHWYAERGDVALPTTERLPFCHAYGCALRATVRITDNDRSVLRNLFAPRGQSAEAERAAVNRAVSWFEKRAHPLLGGPPDVRGSDFAHSGQAGQTDCLDEATNTTTLLIFLQKSGLLHYHSVLRPTSRGGLLLGLVHATAVLRDRDGQDWAVDSWMRDMGDRNDVMPLPEWQDRLF